MKALLGFSLLLVFGCNYPPQKSELMNNSESITSLDSTTDTITLAGGCFWCTEAVYLRMKGVLHSVSGYCGGSVKNPTYREVCMGTTGHAEVVQLTFDKTQTSLEDILAVFFAIHDP